MGIVREVSPMRELSLNTRAAALSEMGSTTLDVLVIGGGVTGAGAALDAALRGLRVGLVEQHDFGSGTSSKSSKMIHGGLRYLRNGDVGVIRESLRERRRLQHNASHLVRPLPMLLPISRSRLSARLSRDRLTFGAAMWTYDALGARRAGNAHRWLDVAESAEIAPGLHFSGLAGSYLYEDDSADDARLVISIIRSAAAAGTLIANGAKVEQLLTKDGVVVGARVDVDGAGTAIEIVARVVINATGVWADTIFSGSGIDPGFEVVPSRGAHLTVPLDRACVRTAVSLYTQTRKNIFVEPWGTDLAFIGTTDTVHSAARDNPQSAEGDRQELLAVINPLLDEPLTESDILCEWAGLRPLVVQRGAIRGSTRNVSRRHATFSRPGIVSLVGGKLTTYRAMAENGVTAAIAQLGSATLPCTTYNHPLAGAWESQQRRVHPSVIAAKGGISDDTARHLLSRYGTEAVDIARICRENTELRRQIHPDRPYIGAEVEFARRYELARSADDVLARRTRLAIETRDGGEAARASISRIFGEVSV